jgi:predicted Zn-dependent peptidase
MVLSCRAALVASLLLIACPAAARQVASAPGPAPLRDLIRSIDIPYDEFTLANGLRVVVSTDRKAPVVAVSVWYDVGSRHEPAGRTGFAHLFEHLMFNGSENAPGDFFGPLKDIGATDYNGTTYYDRTNYFETVPREALARTLFLESDRMGHLLGAVTQASLDVQRGVVQNEKRQGDNEPSGLVQYRTTAALFPKGHPYGHTPIGSMKDLDAASLDDVKAWFRDHYGPNNAVLVLAGDIDVATARTMVERYFGDIPAGPTTHAPAAPLPTLPRAVEETMTDRVSATRIVRAWAIPGTDRPDSVSLSLAAAILGGTDTARLPAALVDGARVATSVQVETDDRAQGGTFEIVMDVRQGVDPANALRRLDAGLAAFLRDGPDKDEVKRYVTRLIARQIQKTDATGGFGGKAAVLAECTLYRKDPGCYHHDLELLASATPQSVRAAARRWLSRPAYTLTVKPGPRVAGQDAAGVPAPAATPPSAAVTPPAVGKRGAAPAVPDVAAVTFPAIRRVRLTNGIELIHAHRPLPVTFVTMNFDAGRVADAPRCTGLQEMTMAVLGRTSGPLDAAAFGAARDRLGMRIGTGGTEDQSRAMMNVPSVNLRPALTLFAAMVRRPGFARSEVDRARDLQLAAIRQDRTTPFGLSARAAAPLVHGPASPYACSGSSGDPAAVAATTRSDLDAFHRAWLRPDKAKIFVVSDRPLEEVRVALDRSFGDWAVTGAPGIKRTVPPAPATPRIVLLDRPDAPQSLVTGWIPTALTGNADLLMPQTANEVLAGGFLSRINMDLREDRHWTYGASGRFRPLEHSVPYAVTTSVQADRTGASIAAIRDDFAAFLGPRPMTQAEFTRTITGSTRALSGSFESSGSVLSAMIANDLYGRPDDYYATIAARYRSFTLPQLQAALAPILDPARAIWVVAGDTAKVRPQLEALRLPVETMTAEQVR